VASFLERELGGQLNHTRAAAAEAGVALGYVWSLRDQAGGGDAGVDASRGQSEVGVVEDVEELGAQLQVQAFVDFRVLGHGEIEVGIARTIDRIAAEIAEGSESGLGEGSGVEVSGEGIPVGQNGVNAGHDVGPLVKVETAGGVVFGNDGNGATALEAGNPVQGPAGAERLGQDVPVGHVVVRCSGEAVASIEGRRAAFGGEVV